MSIFDAIKERLPIADALRKYTLADLKKFVPGRTKQNIPCPFHEDKEPSFRVDQGKNTWFCFAGCGGGDVIDLVAKSKGLDLKEAKDFLQGELAIESANLSSQQKSEMTQWNVSKQKEVAIYTEFLTIIDDYHKCLLLVRNESDFSTFTDLVGDLPQRMPYFEYLLDGMKSKDERLKSFAFEEGKRILFEN